MAEATEKQYRQALRDRMRAAREAKGFSQEHMADLLGVPKDRYIKHEQRGALPPYLMERFAVLTDEDPVYILTGRRPRAAQPVPAKRRTQTA